jgi:DNA modification methylase
MISKKRRVSPPFLIFNFKNMKKTSHRIVQGDCLKLMNMIPDNMIDFVCSDFPYNISNKNGLTMANDKVVKADF